MLCRRRVRLQVFEQPGEGGFEGALRITTFNTTSPAFSLTWTSNATRRYRVENKTDLLAATWTLTLDNILPDGATTTRGGASAASSQRFFRVQAFLPLAP